MDWYCLVLPLMSAVSAQAGAELPRSATWAGLAPQLREPPVQARPLLRWWWFGGAVDEDELAWQLAEMRRAGFGGVEVQPVYPLTVDRPALGLYNLPFLSVEFCARLRFAVQQANRLGMTVDLTLGSGWPYGGPHIGSRERARRIELQQQLVRGPAQLEQPLASGLRDTDRLVAVLAAPVGVSAASDFQDLSGALTQDGILRWTVPDGEWRVVVALARDTEQQVKRPTFGSEGYVHDHFSRPALERHLHEVGDRLLRAVGGDPAERLRCLFCDSWEVYGANWTGDFLDVFRERRGYDLVSFLPDLWDGASDEQAAVRYDYRRTLSELALERFFHPLAEYCERNGLAARVQAHGTPADALLAYGSAHIPEGESYGAEGDRWAPDVHHRRTASSAAHLFDRPICSAEAFTWLRRPRYCVTLEQMKAASDVFFLDGINQLVGHGFPYSPRALGAPGWNFYASTMINPNNPWWPHIGPLTDYIARLSHLLRQGRWVADVAVYLPTGDAWSAPPDKNQNTCREWAERVDEALLRAILDAGYNYDLVNDTVLQQRAKFEDGTLRAGEQAYRILVLPAVRRIPPETLARVRDFAEAGGHVVAWQRLPEAACGYRDFAERSAAVRALAAALAAQGRIACVSDAAALVRRLREVTPDVAFEPVFEPLGFVHRQLDDAHVYFLANVSPAPVRSTVTLRERGVPVLWDPVTAEERPVGEWEDHEGGLRLGLEWEPFESRVVVVRPAAAVPRAFHLRTDLRASRILDNRVLEGIAAAPGEYHVLLAGETVRGEADPVPDPIVLDAGWTLEAPPLDSPRPFDAPGSWTALPEMAHFSGTGTYRTTFLLAAEARREGVRVLLDLGEVREIAEVTLNDQSIDVSWHQPHRLDVTEAAKVGENRLRVAVTNLLINRVLGEPAPDYSELEQAFGRRFPLPREKEEVTEPLPSGLLGPVTVVFERRVRVRLPEADAR